MKMYWMETFFLYTWSHNFSSSHQNRSAIYSSIFCIKLESSTKTACHEVFWGNQPCQYGVSIQHFGDGLCLHHLELKWRVLCPHTIKLPIGFPSVYHWGKSGWCQTISGGLSQCGQLGEQWLGSGDQYSQSKLLLTVPSIICFWQFSHFFTMFTAKYHEWLWGNITFFFKLSGCSCISMACLQSTVCS
jgi:hypothetical protein